MKITLIQVNNDIVGISNRLKKIESRIKNIGKTDFVILPELSTPGYIPNEKIWQYAESEGEITKKWAVEIAKKYNIYIGAGFVQKSNGDIYNSYLLANPNGILGIVRKCEPESNIFKRGAFEHIIETPLGKIAIAICLDSHKKAFYEAIKNENVAMILMPHAWPTDKTKENLNKKKIQTLVTSYGGAFKCPIVFVNAIGSFEKMAGITGKLMNPKKYKLNGNSLIFANDEITEFLEESDNLSVECEIKEVKMRKDIVFYDDWIDKGSKLFRNVVIPLDVKKGVKMYNQAKSNNFNSKQ